MLQVFNRIWPGKWFRYRNLRRWVPLPERGKHRPQAKRFTPLGAGGFGQGSVSGGGGPCESDWGEEGD